MTEDSPKAQASIALIRTGEANSYEYLLIERATNPNDYWSGHLSFPGGKIEPGESEIDAAIRETFEEVGIHLKPNQLIHQQEIGFAGKKGEFGFWVKPYVFHIPSKQEFHIDKREVAQAFWVAEHTFKAQNALVNSTSLFPNQERPLPAIPIKNKVLWGFSLRVLFSHMDIPL